MSTHYGATSSSSKRPRLESAAPRLDVYPPSGSQVTVPFYQPYSLLASRGFAPTSGGEEPDVVRSTGQGNLLERLHGVQQRPTPLPKRPANNGGMQQNMPYMGGNVAGPTNNQLWEQRSKGPEKRSLNAAPPPSWPGDSVIDLTEDDDVVHLEKAPQTKEVCFGMIHRASISAHTTPTTAFGTDVFPDNWPPIPITLRRGGNLGTLIVCALDPVGREFGCVDINTARALVPLLDLKLVRVQARVLSRPKRQGEVAGARVSVNLGVYINLYGPEEKGASVGMLLSQKNVFLQNPMNPDKVEYKNPHYKDGAVQSWAKQSGGPTRTNTVAYVSRTAEEIRADVNNVFDGLEQSDNLPEMEPDPRIKTPLLKHQKQGLHFLTNKEKERTFSEEAKGNSSLWRVRSRPSGQKYYYNVITGIESRGKPAEVLGGILADMMGLGKTLQIISLTVTSLDESKAFAKKKYSPPKEKEKPDGKEKSDDKETPPLLPVKATLLISPLSTIGNWEEQIQAHVHPGTLSTYIYHGSKRETDLAKLANYDMIITTYQVVANEFQRHTKDKKNTSPLQQMYFFRIVLDEAHMIREQSTWQSKAVIALNAQRRWAVTGTPVQNRLDDLAALIKFLRVKPFDEKSFFNQYIAVPFKAADPECIPRLRLLVDSVTLRRLKDRINLPPRKDQTIYLEFSQDEREIYDATARQSTMRMDLVVKTGHVGGKAYVHVLQSILRLRLICAHGRELLGNDDTAGLTSSDAIDVDELDDKPRSSWSAKQAYEIFKLMKEANEDVCSICRKKINAAAVNGDAESKAASSGSKAQVMGSLTPCAHLLCSTCVGTYKNAISKDFREGQQASCPICGLFIRVDLFELKQEEEAAEESSKEGCKTIKKNVQYRGPSTKVKALLKELLDNKEQSTPEDPIKSVVFSCWTTHMDLIEIAFNENGIRFVRLDGRLSRVQRNQAIATFREDLEIEVILVSLMAGGLGLNLTAACKVYVMEPQFNPAAEAQAIDRIHRLGQKRAVTTIRFIMTNSFEEKILQLQKKKTDLANLSMSQKLTRSELTKQKLEDLRSLFK